MTDLARSFWTCRCAGRIGVDCYCADRNAESVILTDAMRRSNAQTDEEYAAAMKRSPIFAGMDARDEAGLDEDGVRLREGWL